MLHAESSFSCAGTANSARTESSINEVQQFNPSVAVPLSNKQADFRGILPQSSYSDMIAELTLAMGSVEAQKKIAPDGSTQTTLSFRRFVVANVF